MFVMMISPVSDPTSCRKRRKTAPKKQVNTLSNYFTSNTASKPKTAPSDPENEDSAAPSTKNPQPNSSAKVIPYCALFPKKVSKKAVPEQDALVCIIEARRPNGKSEFLIEQRPAKGWFPLLAIQYIFIHISTHMRRPPRFSVAISTIHTTGYSKRFCYSKSCGSGIRIWARNSWTTRCKICR